jgi:hypothetical protein
MKKFTFKGVLDGFRSSVQTTQQRDVREIEETLRSSDFTLKKVSQQHCALTNWFVREEEKLGRGSSSELLLQASQAELNSAKNLLKTFPCPPHLPSPLIRMRSLSASRVFPHQFPFVLKAHRFISIWRTHQKRRSTDASPRLFFFSHGNLHEGVASPSK